MEPIPTKQYAKDYLSKNVIPTLLTGLTEVCRKKPKDPVNGCYKTIPINQEPTNFVHKSRCRIRNQNYGCSHKIKNTHE
uniref:Nucleoside diphosphate kinase 5 n=1 Tax=Echinococcus granulosus TaxID=6210 RepID=A0A068WFQ9_ECHGR|nr:nucleoside diphosphate kinase 5 [Echinococcus granulosus]